MKAKAILFPIAVFLLIFSSCIKERAAGTGLLDVKGTSWEITGTFLGQNVTLPLKFTPDGKGTFGNIGITWIQSSNEILWLGTDNTRFEARLTSTSQMKGSFYLNSGEVPSGTFTGKRGL
jgi:hypothetical protein